MDTSRVCGSELGRKELYAVRHQATVARSYSSYSTRTSSRSP